MSDQPRREQFRYIHNEQIRWGDMDAMGHVNHARIIVYGESGRVGYFDQMLGTGSAFDASGAGLILANVNCDFIAQIKYPGSVDVAVRTERLGNSSARLQLAMFSGSSDELVALSTNVVVWFDYAAGQAVSIPDRLRQTIRDFEVVPPE